MLLRWRLHPCLQHILITSISHFPFHFPPKPSHLCVVRLHACMHGWAAHMLTCTYISLIGAAYRGAQWSFCHLESCNCVVPLLQVIICQGRLETHSSRGLTVGFPCSCPTCSVPNSHGVQRLPLCPDTLFSLHLCFGVHLVFKLSYKTMGLSWCFHVHAALYFVCIPLSCSFFSPR